MHLPVTHNANDPAWEAFPLSEWTRYLVAPWQNETDIPAQCRSDGWMVRAVEHVLQGEWSEAQHALDSAIAQARRFHPFHHFRDSAIYLGLAECALRRGAGQEAEKHAKTALFQDHENHEAQALTHGAFLRYEKALEKLSDWDIRTASQVERNARTAPRGNAENPHDAALECFSGRDIPKAFRLLENSKDILPQRPEPWLTAARFYAYLGYYEEAEQELIHAASIARKAHDGYHRAAAAQHMARAVLLLTTDPEDSNRLAYADLVKAIDYDRNWHVPRKMMRQ